MPRARKPAAPAQPGTEDGANDAFAEDEAPPDPPEDGALEGETPEGEPEAETDPDDAPITLTRKSLRGIIQEAIGDARRPAPKRRQQPQRFTTAGPQLSQEQINVRSSSYQALRASEDPAHHAIAVLMEDMSRIDRRNAEADQISEVHPKLQARTRYYLRSGHARTLEGAIHMARGDYYETRFKKVRSQARGPQKPRRESIDDSNGDRRPARPDGPQQRTRLGTFTRNMTSREAVEAGMGRVVTAPRQAIQRALEAPDRADARSIDAAMEKAAAVGARMKKGRLRAGR